MVPLGSKIQSITSVAGHQVIRNLSEPSVQLDIYVGYMQEVRRDDRPESWTD